MIKGIAKPLWGSIAAFTLVLLWGISDVQAVSITTLPSNNRVTVFTRLGGTITAESDFILDDANLDDSFAITATGSGGV